MVAYVIFIKERTKDQEELDRYKEIARAAMTEHPITFRIAHGHREVVEGEDFEDIMMLEFPTFRGEGLVRQPGLPGRSEHRLKGADYRAFIVESV